MDQLKKISTLGDQDPGDESKADAGPLAKDAKKGEGFTTHFSENDSPVQTGGGFSGGYSTGKETKMEGILFPKTNVIPLSPGGQQAKAQNEPPKEPKPQSLPQPAPEKPGSRFNPSYLALGVALAALLVLALLSNRIAENGKQLAVALDGIQTTQIQLAGIRESVVEHSNAILAAQADLRSVSGKLDDLSARLDRQKIQKWKSELNQQASVFQELGKLQDPSLKLRMDQLAQRLQSLSSQL